MAVIERYVLLTERERDVLPEAHTLILPVGDGELAIYLPEAGRSHGNERIVMCLSFLIGFQYFDFDHDDASIGYRPAGKFPLFAFVCEIKHFRFP